MVVLHGLAPSKFLDLCNLEVKEDVVGDDRGALREMVVPFPIVLRPSLIEIDHRLIRRRLDRS